MITNRTKFFINGLMLSAVGLLMRTVQLIFSAYVSRTVGAEGIGLNTLIMTVYSFAVTFATSGISLSVTRLVAAKIGEGKESEAGRVLRGAICYALFFGALSFLLLFSLSGVLSRRVISHGDTATALVILSLSLIPTALSSVINGYFVGVKKVAFNAFVQVVGQAFRIFLSVYLLFVMADGGTLYAVSALCIGTSATEALCFVLSLILLAFDRIKRKNKGRGSDVKAVATMAIPLAVSAYIRSALLTLEHSLIPKRLKKHGENTSEALSSYGYLHGMALPLVLYPMAPLSSFAGLLVPEFAESEASGNKRRLERIAGEAMGTTMIFAVAASVLLYLFSEELGYTVYSSYEAGRYIAFLSPVVPIMYLDHVADAILKGIGEHVYSMWVNIFDVIISIALVFFLLPIMGIAGYAIVIIVMEGFNFSLSLLRLRKRIKFKIDFFTSLIFPALSSAVSVLLSDLLISVKGESVGAGLLTVKLILAVCIFLAVNSLLNLLREITVKKEARS